MNHKIIVAFLGALCVGALIEYAVLFRQVSLGFEPQVSSIQNPGIAEMIQKINQSEIFNTVYDLQNFMTRKYDTAGNMAAGTYLYNRLDNIPRLSVEFQGGVYRNVIATLAGTDPTSTATYIVGAHYDSTSSDPNNAPGATDNGGGVAIVLELARIMSYYKFQHTLKFALWNYEEGGSYGSTDYAQYASNSGLNISLYFNYDSSCYDPDDRFVLDIMYNSQSSWVKDVMTEYNTLYAIGFNLTYNVHTCSSDHRPFWSKGYTAVMTHEETHGPAHSQEDTIDKVSTLYAKKNGQLGMSILAELARVQGPWNSVDTAPPHISILSPADETYSVNSLPLTFEVNEPTSWIGYSMDSQANATISGNASLTDLSNGVHTIVVYANDTAGNMGQSDVVYFTVDTSPSVGWITIAEGATYTKSTVVTLTLSVKDDAFNAVQMRFRYDENNTWCDWEPYATSKSWTLSAGDGTKAVFVQFRDNTGLVSPSYQDTIILDTKRPTADAGNDQTVNEDTVVTLDASASQDENSIASCAWVFTDLTTQTLTGKTTTYTFNTPGVYAITLNITDPAGNWATDTVVIAVLDITEPVANAGQNQTVNLGSSMSFDASGSTDNVGIVTYEWDFGDGATDTGETAVHTYSSPSTYTVTLTVEDAARNSASQSITVTVRSSEPFQLWIAGTAVVTIAVAVAAAMLLRRRK